MPNFSSSIMIRSFICSRVMSSSSLKMVVPLRRDHEAALYQVAMLRVWCDVCCDCAAAGVRLPVASGYIIPYLYS